MEKYSAYEAAEILWRVVSPILIVFGSAGNILVIALLTRKRSRDKPTSIYLSALAFSDLLALNTGLMRQWIKHTFDLDIRVDLTVSGCRFHWFTVYLMTQFSSWMLICVTLERLVCTLLPHRRRILCTPRSALSSVLVILGFLVLLNGHYLFGYGNVVKIVNGTEIIESCQPLTDGYDTFILYTWTWVDLCVFFIIPMVVLLVGNSLIVHSVVVSHKKIRRTVISMKYNGKQSRKNQQQTAKVSSLTVSLTLVSVMFCICIIPVVIYPIGQPYWLKGASESKEATLYLIETIANLLMYVNHAINFLLYFLSGKRFRRQVNELLCTSKASTDTLAYTIASGGHGN